MQLNHIAISCLGLAICSGQFQARGLAQTTLPQNQTTTKQQQDDRRSQKGIQSAQSRQTQRVLITTPGKIAETPQRFYGQKVRVKANVSGVMGPTVFTLDEDEWFAEPDVLVVAPGGTTAPKEGAQVTVTGTLRQFVTSEIQYDYDMYGYGWFGYDWYDYNDVWTNWNRRPAIIADSIRTQNGRELVMQQTQGPPSRQAGKTRHIYVASPGTIAENPQDYYGYFVSSREEVEQVYGPHLFTLDEDQWFAGPDVLVFVPQPEAQASENTLVTVIGQVRPFVIADFERDYEWFDVNWFEYPEILEQWEQEGRPAIVARSVRTEAGRDLVLSPQRLTSAMGAPGRDASTERGGGMGRGAQSQP